MSRINAVKKILRDRGVEMDADDVLAILRTEPRYRVGLARNQVAHTLAELHGCDPDIIRTRRGLYRYRDTGNPRPPTPIPAPPVQPIIAEFAPNTGHPTHRYRASRHRIR